MLSDPISVTYDSVPTDLARSSGYVPTLVSRQRWLRYGNQSPGLSLVTSVGRIEAGYPLRLDRYEFTLMHQAEETDYPNGVGFVFYVDPFRENTSVEVPLLDTALRAKVDATLRSKLLNGEY